MTRRTRRRSSTRGNSDKWVTLGRTYGSRFPRGREMCDRVIAIAPDEPDITSEKADTFISDGNLDAAQAILAHAEPDVMGGAFGSRVSLAMLRRQFDRAIELLTRGRSHRAAPDR